MGWLGKYYAVPTSIHNTHAQWRALFNDARSSHMIYDIIISNEPNAAIGVCNGDERRKFLKMFETWKRAETACACEWHSSYINRFICMTRDHKTDDDGNETNVKKKERKTHRGRTAYKCVYMREIPIKIDRIESMWREESPVAQRGWLTIWDELWHRPGGRSIVGVVANDAPALVWWSSGRLTLWFCRDDEPFMLHS